MGKRWDTLNILHYFSDVPGKPMKNLVWSFCSTYLITLPFRVNIHTVRSSVESPSRWSLV